jgi:hypothetical protein
MFVLTMEEKCHLSGVDYVECSGDGTCVPCKQEAIGKYSFIGHFLSFFQYTFTGFQ